jgi:NAD+ kinase
MRVAIFSRPLKEESLPIIEGLLETLVNNGASLLVYEQTAKQLSPVFKQRFSFGIFTDQATLIDKADVMVSVGGDGTLLDTVSLIQYADLPVLGFNLGRLGYLASVSKQSMQVAVQQLIQGDFSVERRTMVHLTS